MTQDYLSKKQLEYIELLSWEISTDGNCLTLKADIGSEQGAKRAFDQISRRK